MGCGRASRKSLQTIGFHSHRTHGYCQWMPASTLPCDSAGASGDLRRLARGGAFALGGVVVSAALQFGLVLAVTHGLPRPSAGAFLEAVALFMILSNWCELGADTGMVRIIPRFRVQGRDGDVRPLLWAAVIPVVLAGSLAGWCVYAFAGQASGIFFGSAEQSSGRTLLQLLAPAVPISCTLTVLLAATRGYGRLRPYVTMTNVAVPASRLIAVVAAIAVFGDNTSALALAWTLPLAVCLVIAWGIVGRLVPARSGGRTAGIWSELWRFAAPRGLAVGFAVMVSWVDVLLVGAIAGPRNAAVYAAISRLAVIGAYGLQAVGMVVAPRFSALVTAGDRDRLEHFYQVATWWTVIVAAPLYMLVLVFAPLCARIFGNGYGEGATALAVLAVAGLVNLGTGNVMVLLLMAGKSTWTLFDAGGSLAVNLALNVLLIPQFGITGAAISWSVSIIGTNLVALFQLHRSLGLRPFGRGYPLACAAPAICFGLVGVVARLLLGDGVEAALSTVAVGSMLYLVALFRFRGDLLLGELTASVRRARPAVATS